MSGLSLASGLSGTPGAVQKIAASAIPFIIAPTGSMANNGVITLGTALPATYANAYINLPASAIQAGSAAGWYFCQMSSATVGTVFLNNPYVSGLPSIPPAPVAPATTGPGAYVGVTGATNGPQITIPAGVLGPNGTLRLSQLNSVNAAATTKTLQAFIAGTNIWGVTFTTAAQFGLAGITTLQNRGAQNANVTFSTSNAAGVGVAASANVFSSINFAAAQTLTFALTTTVATDFIVLESFLIEAIPG